jgi:histone deacetylase complex regulatory component SIN3
MIGWKMENKSVKIDDATQYVTAVKKTYENNPEVYRNFLKILSSYQKKEFN